MWTYCDSGRLNYNLANCYVPLYFFHFVSTYLRWDKLRKLMTMRVAIWLKSIKELPSILSGLLLDPFKPNYSWSP
jgi:hypothetical protein